MFAIILTLLWYLFVTSILLVLVVLLLVVVKLSDFPNRRRACTSTVKLTGKTVVVTGCNTGVGYEAAKDFASRGARVIMACRNMEKAEIAKSKIVSVTGNDNIATMQCDLSDLESVRCFCKEFLAKKSALHILVNNAGVPVAQGLTKQNFHYTFGTNYVGPFLLTYLLLDLIKKSSPSRIINVSSGTHALQHEMGLKIEENGIKFPQMESYRCSKLANILHAKELARVLTGTGVTTYSLTPGFVYSGMPSRTDLSLAKTYQDLFFMTCLQLFKFLSRSAKEGAQTIVFCAVDESVASQSGKYYHNLREKTPNKLAFDADLARRLWNVTLDAVKDYTNLNVKI